MSDNDLPKWQKYRLKDLEGYRKRKREYARTPEQRRKQTEYMRLWRQKNRKKHNAAHRLYYSNHKDDPLYKEKRKDENLRRQYGITLNQKVAMIEEQDGRCKICARVFLNERSTHVDHCHNTGKIRGILCNVCNTKLEWYENNKHSIFKYLDETYEEKR